MPLRMDPWQERACHVQRNAVVMAGAGSGKTSVVAERFTWLLETRRARLDQVLCLTFTRKATAEMVEKIYRRLKESADPQVRLQLEGFDQAQISTLDSFCTQVARNACTRYGLSPDFRCEEESLDRLAREVSERFVLAHLGRPGLDRLIARFGFERVVAEVFTRLAVQHLPLTAEPDFPGMIERQLETLRRETGRELAAWQESARALLEMEPRTATIRRRQDDLRALPALAALHGAGDHGRMIESLEGLDLSKPGGKAAEDTVLLKEILDRLQRTRSSLLLLAGSLEQEEPLRDLFRLLPLFQDEYGREKRRRGILAFHDVAHLAVRALREDHELRRFYKERFSYIMIDEFQDNNQLQKDLLYLLAERRDRSGDRVPGPDGLEPEKLFFVGDEKQSIYRFRGADVSVFKSLSGELERRGGEVVRLPTNYRSEPGLVLLFNRLFERIMAGAEAPYEARFEKLEPRETDNREKPRVLFLYRPPANGLAADGRAADGGGEGAASSEDTEAYRVGEALLEAVNRRLLRVPDVSADGQPILRPAGFEDFALLLRSTGNQIRFERVFRRLNIPYTTQHPRGLFMEAPLYDFYQLLQLVVYPRDLGAYAALLRSPLVNLSDPALLRVLGAGRPPFQTDGLETLEEEDLQRLALGRELWEQAAGWADRVPLSELVDRLWAQSGYSYSILRDQRNHNFLDYQEYLVRMAERADRCGQSLAEFLDFLRENLGGYQRVEELELLKGSAAGVQILTIHRSKGLEFPVVVLADTGNCGRSSSQESAPCYHLPGHGLTFNLGRKNWFAWLGQEEEKKEETAELKRLLYVALTRARSHLIVSGSHTTRNRDGERNHLNMLLGALQVAEPQELEEDHPLYNLQLRLVEEVGEEETRRSPGAQPAADPGALSGLYESAGGVRLDYPRREFSVTQLAARFEAERGAAPAAVRRLPDLPVDGVLRDQELDRVFGSLTHELIQRRLLGLEETDGIAADGIAADGGEWLPEALAASLPAEHRPALLAGARRLAAGFLGSPWGGAPWPPGPASPSTPSSTIASRPGSGAGGPLLRGRGHRLGARLQDRPPPPAGKVRRPARPLPPGPAGAHQPEGRLPGGAAARARGGGSRRGTRPGGVARPHRGRPGRRR